MKILCEVLISINKEAILGIKAKIRARIGKEKRAEISTKIGAKISLISRIRSMKLFIC